MLKGKTAQSVGGSRLSFPYYDYDEILQICTGALRSYSFCVAGKSLLCDLFSVFSIPLVTNSKRDFSISFLYLSFSVFEYFVVFK